jgi:hypothetical protein
MAYEARVFQILIASPGDVQEERKILADVIYEWNNVNSRDRRVVLLPLRWETHSAPEMGSSPQAIINSQVVDQCDMAIGIFWTRLGTPTSEAESGTAEEIERVGNAGKHVMLYFSKAKVDIDRLDIDEYGRLREFKAKTYPQGLVESYGSVVEFREKLTRQLAMKLLTLITEHSREQAHEAVEASELLAIVLGSPAEVLAPPVTIQIPKVVCTNPDEVPPFEDNEEQEEEQSSVRIGMTSMKPNRNYYRELVDFFVAKSAYRPLRLGLKSLSNQGIRDVYLEMRVEGAFGQFKIIPDPGPPLPPRKLDSGTVSFNSAYNSFNFNVPNPPALLRFNEDASSEARIEIELPVVQAHRTIFSVNEFVIQTDGSPAVGIIEATVYSGNMPPFSLQIKVEVQITERRLSYQQILEEVQKTMDERE